MMSLYSGTPGSGKSLDVAREIYTWIKVYKKNVIANISIDRDKILQGKEGGEVFFIDNEDITPEFFYQYALKNHKLGVEHQSLIVFDECQSIFSPVVCKLKSQENKNYRKEWLDFFTQHRHLGFDIIMVTQFDKLVDAQIRYLFEYNYIHRKANNFSVVGQLLTIFHVQLFVCVQVWCGTFEKCGSRMFRFRKKYGEIYDSYAFRKKCIQILLEKYGEKQMKKIMGIRYDSLIKELNS